MHDLQTLFATAEAERTFEEHFHRLFAAGDLDGAETLLADATAMVDGEIARLCRELRREDVALTGWDELAEGIAQHEGEPVAAVTLAIANELDLAFEKGQLHEPYVMLGLYTDEAFAFSAATAEQLLAECRAEIPAWAGYDEDVELYLGVEGLGPLNTALLFHKQRHFFRDDNPAQAPLRYVDYVLGCWWRALRFQQAVATEYARRPLPGAIPAIAGMVEMRPEVVAIHTAAAPAAAERRAGATEMGEMSAADFIQRKPLEEVEELTGAGLRRRFAGSAAEIEEAAEKPGLLGRLFGRAKGLQEAA
jgi:hypothetical protein